MENHAPELLFLAFAVWQIVEAFGKLHKRIDKIDVKCKYEKNNYNALSQKVDRVLNNLHNQRKYYQDNGKKKEVLVFDDDEQSAFLVSESLRKIFDDTNITIAYNLTNAIALLKIQLFDLILSDLKHDNKDYGEIYKQIIDEQNIQTNFVLYSGCAEKPDKYDGIFLDKFEIIKNPEILKEYL